MLVIRLLGTPEIMEAAESISIPRHKSRAVLYYLAAHSTPLTRNQLLAFFWPDAERQAAQQNLRATLYGLRQIVGDSLQVGDDTLALGSESQVDVRLFTQTITQANPTLDPLQAALSAYRGDFLAGFTLPDLPEFDDWAERERTRYQRLFVTGLLKESQLHESTGNYRQALASIERALSLDALQEDLQRSALRLQTLAGDRAGAIRRFDGFRQLLLDEMGVPPMEETQALYDAIITDRFQPVAVPAGAANYQTTLPLSDGVARPTKPPTLPFVGRSQEMQTLQQAVDAHQLILLEGEAGIGKSRLLDEFIQAQAEAPGNAPLLLLGQAHELESSLPYQPIIDGLRTLIADPQWPVIAAKLTLSPLWRVEMARLLPEFAHDQWLKGAAQPISQTTGADELRLWEGVSQFLLAIAHQSPLCVVLDDLHWADASTIGLLGYCLRKARQQRAAITFLAAMRSVAASTPLARLLEALLREGSLLRIHLERLPEPAIADVVHHLRQQASPFLVKWLTRLSEGNPFILLELLRYARDHYPLLLDEKGNERGHETDSETGSETSSKTSQGKALLDETIIPQTLYTLVQSRLARLSDAARQVLNSAAVIGREVEYEMIAGGVALSDVALLDGLDELQQAGLLQPIDGTLRYRFDHSLTRQVAYQEMGLPRRRLLHRRVADLLENLYHKQSDQRSEKASDGMTGLLAYHFGEAGQLVEAARYAYRAGQHAAGLAAWQEAIHFYQQASHAAEAIPDQSMLQAARLALGGVSIHAGQFTQAIEVFRLALKQGMEKESGVRSHKSIVQQTQAHSGLGVNGLGVEEQEEQSERENAIYEGLMEALLMSTRYEELLAVAETISKRPTPVLVCWAEYYRGITLSQMGIPMQEAIAHLQRSERLLDEIKQQSQAHQEKESEVRSQKSIVQQTQAHMKKEGESEGARSPMPRTPAGGKIEFELGNIFARSGELTIAIQHFRSALALSADMQDDRDLPIYILAHNNLAYHLHLQHDPTAFDYAQSSLTLAQEKGVLSVLPYLYSTLGEIALSQQALDQAEGYFQQGLALAQQFSAGERIAGLQANLGLVAHQRGDQTVARHYLTTALAQTEALNLRFQMAQIHLWLAEMSPEEQAQGHLAQARQIAEQDGYQELLNQALCQPTPQAI